MTERREGLWDVSRGADGGGAERVLGGGGSSDEKWEEADLKRTTAKRVQDLEQCYES